MAIRKHSGSNSAANPSQGGSREEFQRGFELKYLWLCKPDYQAGVRAAKRGSRTASSEPPKGIDRQSWMLGWCDVLERANPTRNFDAPADKVPLLDRQADPARRYSDGDLEDWWGALSKEQRKRALLAAIDSGEVPLPEDVAAPAPKAGETAGDVAAHAAGLGLSSTVTCRQESLRIIEKIVIELSERLGDDHRAQRTLFSLADRLAAILEGREWRDSTSPSRTKPTVVRFNPDDRQRGFFDAIEGRFSVADAPEDADLPSWLLGVSDAMETSHAARVRASEAAAGAKRFIFDAERLGLAQDAASQIGELMTAAVPMIRTGSRWHAALGIAIRARELSNLVETALYDRNVSTGNRHCLVRGTLQPGAANSEAGVR